jgi:hypothetical protein
LLAWAGAVLAVACGGSILWTVAIVAREFYPLFKFVLFSEEGTGSGGIGAVSAGAQIPMTVLALLPSIVINRRLAGRVRTERGWLASFHRFHSALLLVVAVGCALLVLAIPFGAFLSLTGMFAVEFLTLLVIGLQFVVLAAILGIVASKPGH